MKRLALNFVAVAIVLLLLLLAVSQNDAYAWAWNVYVKRNLMEMRSLPNAPIEQRLGMKLGEDYQYLLFLRESTPPDAVIYYPTQGDFAAMSDEDGQCPFTGKLCDKLSALRVLYPRRLVVEAEYGKTPWSNRLTHVAIVGGRNKDKLPYDVPDDYVIGVLPVSPETLPLR